MGREFSGSHHKLSTPSYTFTGFHRWKLITTYTKSFTLWGIYPCLLSPDTYFHFYVCNRATLLDVQQYRVHQSITKPSVDLYHPLTPMSCDVPVHNAMQCATTCLCHTTYVRNVIWTTQTTQFIMCHEQLS